MPASKGASGDAIKSAARAVYKIYPYERCGAFVSFRVKTSATTRFVSLSAKISAMAPFNAFRAKF
ncbi:hypothetical protein [uncultured Campylobacter sp.]|uniref:hypothetical protein n=1 Tax=uncultured Campylobacter sp. TaxID=218934 RepID=UPI002628712E|nr:hypothetical protein [uncultured Campylobacter sp.]